MDSAPRVMVVEDAHTVRTVIGEYLRSAGYAVELHGDGATAAAALG
ncbi:hypothetical protein [Microbacterium paludicola]